jgi:phospholipid/cholesterol/gamma-HCH transport system substrate-binding protein
VLANADATLKRISSVLAAAPLDHTLVKLDSAATHLDSLAGDPALKQTLQNVTVLSGQLRKLTDDGDIDRLVKGIDEAAARLDVLLGDNQYDVRTIVQDLRMTAGNLRALSDTIRRDPAGILIGGPPEKVHLPRGAP